MHKPYASACDRNRDPILTVLRVHFADRRRVLEVGSGTGQHAVYFASRLPHLGWQTSDRTEALDDIESWVRDHPAPNLPPPVEFDVDWSVAPAGPFDALFSANTLHIMGWPEVMRLFGRLDELLAARDAKLAIYGPFNYGGRFTSDSNAAFDAALRSADPRRGIRDFEQVDALAAAAGFTLAEDCAMPANNRCVIWKRVRL